MQAVSWATQRSLEKTHYCAYNQDQFPKSCILCSGPSPEFCWRRMGWVFPITSQPCWTCGTPHRLEHWRKRRSSEQKDLRFRTVHSSAFERSYIITTPGFRLCSLSLPSSNCRKSRLIGKILNICSFGSQISKWLNNSGGFTASPNRSKLYENPIICQCHLPPTH